MVEGNVKRDTNTLITAVLALVVNKKKQQQQIKDVQEKVPQKNDTFFFFLMILKMLKTHVRLCGIVSLTNKIISCPSLCKI